MRTKLFQSWHKSYLLKDLKLKLTETIQKIWLKFYLDTLQNIILFMPIFLHKSHIHRSI